MLSLLRQVLPLLKTCPQAFEGIEAELLSRQKELLVSPVAGFSLSAQGDQHLYAEAFLLLPALEIMVLSGSQQGIDLITRAFINPGDLILIEEPSFFPAMQSFRAAGAKIMAGFPWKMTGWIWKSLSSFCPGTSPNSFIQCLPTIIPPASA